MTDPQTPPVPTPDDFRLLSKAQHRCLAYYAVGAALGGPVLWELWDQRTIGSLVLRGMLERVDRPMNGGLTIYDYEMPIAAHIAWCEWCDDTTPIICRTLRQVDALVAEHLFGAIWGKGHVSQLLKLFPADHEMTLFSRVDAPGNLDGANLTDSWDYFLPHYTTWPLMGEVVAKVEAAGYHWDLTYGNPTSIHAAIIYDQHCSVIAAHEHELAPVAFNLAALAAFGRQVQLELD